MKSYKITVGTSTYRSESITLGQVGENLAREIVFDCTAFERLYGDGTANVIAELPTGVKYPVAVEQEGAIVRWKVQSADVGVKGSGHAELQWIVNEVIAKTQVFSTRIRESLTGTDVPEPPDPYQDWVDQISAVGAQARIDAASAHSSAQSAAESKDAAHTSEENAVSSAQNAAGSASAASVSEVSASESASSAMTSASAAYDSEVNAKQSETSAQSSAESAGNSAQNAALSAEGAADSASYSATSASSAAGSASTAINAATNAGTSAQSAANSADNAQAAKIAAQAAASSSALDAENAAISAATATSQASSAAASSTSATTAKNDAITAKNDAITAKNTAVAAKNEILTVEHKLDTISEFYLAEGLLDSSNSAIQDSSNADILGRVTFAQAGDVLSLQNQIAGIYGIFEQERANDNQRFALLEDKLQAQITLLESAVNNLIQHALLDSSYN